MIDFDNTEDLQKQLDNLLNNIDETELIILKCHLLLEFALNKFLTDLTKNRDSKIIEDLSFIQKVKVCKLLGLFDDAMGKSIEIFIVDLNKLRNQIAHKITFSSELLEKLCLADLYDPSEDNDMKGYLRNQLKALSLLNSGMIIGIGKRISNPNK